MTVADLVSLIQRETGISLRAAGEMHLPLALRLERCVLSDETWKGTFVESKGQLIALNLAKQELQEKQLDFLKDSAFSSLQVLNLAYNTFTQLSLPATLENLEILELSGNPQLEALTFVAALPKLRKCNIIASGLSEFTLAEGFKALEYLDLTKSENLEKVDISVDAPKLRHLYLSQCKLKKLCLGKGLDELTYVLANQNQLKILDIPEGLLFNKLETLDLRNNEMEEVNAAFLAQFPSLLNLRLTDNSLSEAILSNLGKSPAEDLTFLKRYTQDLEKKSTLDNECKVLLVGNGSVGKSCMVRRIVYDTFDPTYKSTHGISLEQYPKSNESTDTKNQVKPYLLNIWDFGGQDIYHATHRLFMQTGAVYLVLWDHKTLPDENPYSKIEEKGVERQYPNFRLYYWLSYAKTQGKGSPVIVVQTKIGQAKKRDRQDIRDQFDEDDFSYFDFHHIDSSVDDWKKNGYKKLMLLIKMAIESIKEDTQIPSSWDDIRTEIRRRQLADEKQMEMADFTSIAAAYKEPADVLNWLSKTGVVFHQQGLFQDQIILDQGWAINAVYALFDRTPQSGVSYHDLMARQEAKGYISGQDLAAVWTNKSEAEMKLFVDFMLSCEICLDITPEDKERHSTSFNDRRFVAPQLLAETKARAIAGFWKGRQALHMQYEHEFLHHGVIQSFIIRTHFLKNNLGESNGAWQSGILLEEGDHFAEVASLGNKVEIRVTEGGKDLLDKIRNELIELQDQAGKISVSVDGQFYVGLQELEKEIEQTKNTEIRCINTEGEGKVEKMERFSPFLNPNQTARFKPKYDIPFDIPFLMNDPNQITELVGKGYINEALKQLQLLAKQKQQNTLINATLLLSARQEGNEHKNRMRTISAENYNLERNKIITALLEYNQVLQSGAIPSAVEPVISTPANNNQAIKILFMAAQPDDRTRLQTEFDTVRQKVQESINKGELSFLLPSWETNYDKLLTRLKNEQPQVLHYSGHGTQGGMCLINNKSRKTQLLENDELEEVFEDRTKYLHLVLLNSCFSSHQAEIISQQGLYVLGIKDQKIADELAVDFAENFYLGFTSQEAPINLKKAIRTGCRNFTRNYPDKADVISLWKNGQEIDYKQLK